MSPIDSEKPAEVEILLDELKEFLKDIKIPEPRRSLPISTGSGFSTLSIDGRLDIHITEDRMSVFMDFFPPRGNGFPLGKEQACYNLAEAQIRAPVYWEQIMEALRVSQFDHQEVRGLLVAKGTLPSPEIPAHWVLDSYLSPPQEKGEKDSLKNKDYKKNSPFIQVVEGQILARYQERSPGKEGADILGSPLPWNPIVPPNLEPGEGTQIEETPDQGRILKATKTGRVKWEMGILVVEEILEIPGNVDYHTGHINFPGHVIIGGLVLEGFNVKAGKSLHFRKTLDASLVECGEDLTCDGGILGGGHGKVIVQGNVKAKFVENCYLEARGTIEITGSVLNSQIKTLTNLFLGEKSILVGCKVLCKGNLRVQQLGTSGGSSSEILMGLDWQPLEELTSIRDKSLHLVQEKKRLQALLSISPSEADSIAILQTRITAAIATLAYRARDLSAGLEENSDSQIHVGGMVFPGTLIEICHVTQVVRTPVSRVIIRLNKNEGKLDFLPIPSSSKNPDKPPRH